MLCKLSSQWQKLIFTHNGFLLYFFNKALSIFINFGHVFRSDWYFVETDTPSFFSFFFHSRGNFMIHIYLLFGAFNFLIFILNIIVIPQHLTVFQTILNMNSRIFVLFAFNSANKRFFIVWWRKNKFTHISFIINILFLPWTVHNFFILLKLLDGKIYSSAVPSRNYLLNLFFGFVKSTILSLTESPSFFNAGRMRICKNWIKLIWILSNFFTKLRRLYRFFILIYKAVFWTFFFIL